MRVGKLTMAVGATVCLLGTGGAALAASHPKGGKIHIFVTMTSTTKAKILITGAVGDYGKAVSQDAKGKVDPNGDFEKVTLKHGGFKINATPLDRKLNRSKPKVNKTNCSILFETTGSATVGHGTGAYKGISGKLRITAIFAGIAEKTAKGCNLAGNAPSHGDYQSITGTGKVSFK